MERETLPCPIWRSAKKYLGGSVPPCHLLLGHTFIYFIISAPNPGFVNHGALCKRDCSRKSCGCIVGFAFRNSGAPRKTTPTPENVTSGCYLYYSSKEIRGEALICLFVEPFRILRIA